MKLPTPVEMFYKSAQAAKAYLAAQDAEIAAATEKLVAAARITDPKVADHYIELVESYRTNAELLAEALGVFDGSTDDEE